MCSVTGHVVSPAVGRVSPAVGRVSPAVGRVSPVIEIHLVEGQPHFRLLEETAAQIADDLQTESLIARTTAATMDIH